MYVVPKFKTIVISDVVHNWASRIFDIRPSCLEWSSNKLERSYTNFSGFQETIENTLFHDDVNSGNAPLRRLFERRITNTSFNSIQFNTLESRIVFLKLFATCSHYPDFKIRIRNFHGIFSFISPHSLSLP